MQNILAKNVELGDEVGRPEFEFLMQYITSGKKNNNNIWASYKKASVASRAR